MLPRSFAASLIALLTGVPVALAFFNSTLISTGRGNEDLDISTLQGQRVVKLVQHTPPSITTTWLFFNLFSPLEMTEDFPEDSEDCIGHEACIVRTLILRGSKPVTMHVIPFNGSHFISPDFDIGLENYYWAHSQNLLHIDFVCNNSVINSMKSGIFPLESYAPRYYPQSDVATPKSSTFSNFFGIRRFKSFGDHVSLTLETNITCAKKKFDYEGYEPPSLAGYLIKLILISVLTALVSFFAGAAYGKRRRSANNLNPLPLMQTIVEFHHSAGSLSRKLTRRWRNIDAT
ncbi:uncharacterized protein V1516DRAFT_541181 [Lipomyces oligophaga]|uniref:uncharacterized protein n=1 Tax=Lipomyces oligophaga TaxID=45792 RepID=UPI0034D0197B